MQRKKSHETDRVEFARDIEALIYRSGGVAIVAERMRELGAAKHEPILGEQLHQLFGTGVLRAFAAKLNMHPRELVRRLRLALPETMVRLSTP